MKTTIIQLGNAVEKVTGDYTFRGIVVAKFWKRNGYSERLVVENADGILHIFSESNLTQISLKDYLAMTQGQNNKLSAP